MLVRVVVTEDEVVFSRDEKSFRYKASKGFDYILEIVEFAEEDVPFILCYSKLSIADELVDKLSGEEAFNNMPEDAIIPFISPLRIPVTDTQTVGECFRELHKLKNDRVEAKANNDIGLVDSLTEDIEKIKTYLNESYNPKNGSIKFFPDEYRKYSHSVYVAVKRAIARIKVNDPDLAEILEKSIKIGSVCYYRPLCGLRFIVKHITKQETR